MIHFDPLLLDAQRADLGETGRNGHVGLGRLMRHAAPLTSTAWFGFTVDSMPG